MAAEVKFVGRFMRQFGCLCAHKEKRRRRHVSTAMRTLNRKYAPMLRYRRTLRFRQKTTLMTTNSDIARKIAELERRLSILDEERKQIVVRLAELKTLRATPASPSIHVGPSAHVTMNSSTAAKIALFRSLFRGREDVFPQRWDNAKTGKSGYSPVCRNEWVRGVCGKPQVKCGECPNQAFKPVTDEIIRAHLQGKWGLSPPVSIPCCPMRPAGFWLPISTNIPG